MSSFFDRLKSSVGISKKDSMPSKPGNVLGTGNKSAPATNPPTSSSEPTSAAYIIFEKVFHEEKLGMGIQEHREKFLIDAPDNKSSISRAFVQSVNPNTEAQKLGIQPSDVILSLNGFELAQFDDFYNFLAGMGRPLTIKFYRAKTKSFYGKGGVSSIFKGLGSSSNQSQHNNNGHQSTSSQQTVLSEEEKKQRREMMSNAAKDRTQQWDKKVAAGKSKAASPRVIENNTFNDEVTNPETLRVIQKTKELEVKIEQQLGYSPFRPHMSFTGTEAAANAIKTNNVPNQSNAPVITAPNQLDHTPIPGVVITDEEVELMIAEVDDAFAMLLSLGEAEQETAKIAVQTVQKMLQNLYSNKQDPKFRSIRLSNKAFQSKVASVSGAVELLVAAGYQYDPNDPTAPSGAAASSSNNDPSTTLKMNRYSLDDDLSSLGLSNGVATTPYLGKEGFLTHNMDIKSERKLEYTLSRLQELMEVQAQSP